MTETVLGAVAEKVTLAPSVRDRLTALLREAERECRAAAIPMPQDRLTLLGVHLAATIERVDTGEKLDPFSDSVMSQATPESLAIARRLLTPLGAAALRPEELFLVAVHLDTARYMGRKEK